MMRASKKLVYFLTKECNLKISFHTLSMIIEYFDWDLKGSCFLTKCHEDALVCVNGKSIWYCPTRKHLLSCPSPGKSCRICCWFDRVRRSSQQKKAPFAHVGMSSGYLALWHQSLQTIVLVFCFLRSGAPALTAEESFAQISFAHMSMSRGCLLYACCLQSVVQHFGKGLRAVFKHTMYAFSMNLI